MKKRMGRKTKVLAAVLLAGVLCAGTVVAQAGSENCRLGNHYVSAETYASKSTYSAMARTVSSSYAVHTGVQAYYEYYDPILGDNFELEEWDNGLYGSEVTFSLPSGAQRATMISADHNAEYGGQNWVCKTIAYFDR